MPKHTGLTAGKPGSPASKLAAKRNKMSLKAKKRKGKKRG